MLDEEGRPIELGHGAMGVTYKALDVDLRCAVTLKVISERYLGDQSARLRFLREARAAASVRHPNVASVLHLGRTGSSYFYAMEFVEGETVEHLIRRSGRVEVKLALEIATQMAAGLAAVNKRQLVHRDIKPSNIMVSLEEGGAVTVKIIDLGLAKGVEESGSQTPIFDTRDLCWNARVRQSRAICGNPSRHPLGPVLTWSDALEDADGADAISGHLRRGDVSASARTLTARTTQRRPSADRHSTCGAS
jgi:serine/threonine protein kinase